MIISLNYRNTTLTWKTIETIMELTFMNYFALKSKKGRYDEKLKHEIRNNISIVTLNVPEKLNALVAEMKEELYELMREIRDNKSIRAVLITGEGRAFCAGGDVSTMGDKLKDSWDWIRSYDIVLDIQEKFRKYT